MSACVSTLAFLGSGFGGWPGCRFCRSGLPLPVRTLSKRLLPGGLLTPSWDDDPFDAEPIKTHTCAYRKSTMKRHPVGQKRQGRDFGSARS